MKKWMRRVLLWGILIIGISGFSGYMTAEAASQKLKVVVPLMSNIGFASLEDGELAGYYVDYLEEISMYTGWEYEYVPIDNYDDFDRICETGDFDLMPGIVYAETYDEEYFDYPEQPIGAKRYVLAVPKDSGIVADREYAFLRGIKIGIAQNTGITELEQRFADFCKMQGIDTVTDPDGDYEKGVEFVHIDPTERVTAQASGAIDGILASDAVCLQLDMYAAATFGLDQMFFVVPNGQTEILQELDFAIEQITTIDPEYNDRLYDMYFAANTEYEIAFDQQEQNYLSTKHTYKVAMLEGYAPYSYIRSNGEEAGMLHLVFDSIHADTYGQMNFSYSYYSNMEEIQKALETGECDLTGASMYSLLMERDNEFRRSTSFYQDAFVVYKKNGRLQSEDSTTAVMMPKLTELLENNTFTDTEEVIYGTSVEECMTLISNQVNGYTVLLEKVGDYIKSYQLYEEIYSYSVPEGAVSLCLAYAPHLESVAGDIMDKCLAQVSRAELDSYIMDATIFEHERKTLREYAEENIMLFSMVFGGIWIIICVLLSVIIINVSRNSRKIHDILYTDEVTGGPSYKKFMEEAEKDVRERRSHRMVLYININGFKYINDVFGYSAGNDVLREVYYFLEKKAAPKDLFARMYADRFVILFSNAKNKERFEELIYQGFEEFEELCRRKYPSFAIWFKAGAYVLQPGDTVQKAVNLANYAMDSVETTAQNVCIFYDEEMHDTVLHQKNIERDMWDALIHEQFKTFYQPKYNLENHKLIGAEALVRWQHPQKGLLPPGSFIPVFEKNHFIIQVDYYVFENVCRFLHERIDKGKEPVVISSNFSRLHLLQPDFAKRLTEIVERHQVPAKYLEIEITETVATENFEEFVGTIKNLKGNGFQVSIDDFGSGYSSIQLLYKLPIDVVKFDRDFVVDGESNSMKMELLDNIISVTQKRGIKIICEGVETLEQEAFVQNHHCKYVQGFLYSRPVPEEEFVEIMEKAFPIGP